MPFLVVVSDVPALERRIAEELGAAYRTAALVKRRWSPSALQALAPDLVLLHLDHGDQDASWTALAELKGHADPVSSTCRVVVIGPDIELLRIRSMIDGALDYVAEPLRSDALRSAVEAALASAPEPVLRQVAQRRALKELAELERAGTNDGRRSRTRAKPVSDEWTSRVRLLSPGQRRVLFAIGQTESLAGAARLLDVTGSRVSAQLRSAARRLEVDRDHLVGLARSGALLSSAEVDLQRLGVELDAALHCDQLVVDYQPIIALHDGRMVGAEALVRWKHPSRGLLAPRQFLPVAEVTGAMWPLTELVLREACEQAARWSLDRCGENLYVTVNISNRVARRSDLADTVGSTLQGAGLDPGLLVLDIPAATLTAAPASARAGIERVRELGVRVAADDFGSAVSSWHRRAHLPIDILKIDSSFVAGLGRTTFDTAVVTATLSIAGSLGVATHAKGVETHHELEMLTSLGCLTAQGFHLGPPAPPEQLPLAAAPASGPGGAAAERAL